MLPSIWAQRKTMGRFFHTFLSRGVEVIPAGVDLLQNMQLGHESIQANYVRFSLGSSVLNELKLRIQLGNSNLSRHAISLNLLTLLSDWNPAPCMQGALLKVTMFPSTSRRVASKLQESGARMTVWWSCRLPFLLAPVQFPADKNTICLIVAPSIGDFCKALGRMDRCATRNLWTNQQMLETTLYHQNSR